MCQVSWETKGTPARNKALLRDYQPLVSLNKALLWRTSGRRFTSRAFSEEELKRGPKRKQKFGLAFGPNHQPWKLGPSRSSQ